MCAIVGWSDPHRVIDPGQKRMVAYLSHKRGEGGVGAVAIEGRRNIAWKSGMSIVELVKKVNFRESPFERDFVMMHNRRPSHSLGEGSKVCAENSHPFTYGHITLAHNGIIENHKDIAKKLAECGEELKKFAEDYLVDSNVLAAAINQWGVKEALSMVEGKASVWWVDDRLPGESFLWCWNQDLALYSTGGATIFASELEFLELAGIKGIKLADDKGQLFRIKQSGKCERLEDVKGKAKEVQHSATYKNNYEYNYPDEIAKSTDEELRNAFAVMNGHCCGICSKCNTFIPHWHAIERKIDGIDVLVHSAGCGGVLFPMTAARGLEYLAYYSSQAKEENCAIIQKYWNQLTTDRQLRWPDAVDQGKKLTEDYFPLWLYCTEEEAVKEYDAKGAKIDSAMRRLRSRGWRKKSEYYSTGRYHGEFNEYSGWAGD